MRFPRLLLVAYWMFALLLPRLSAPIAANQTFTVTITSDEFNGCTPASCSLREAIQAANQAPGLDTIRFSASGIYQLSLAGNNENLNQTGDLDILDDLVITADDVAGAVIVDGGTIDRVINITATAQVTISTITIQNGLAPNINSIGGGGILIGNGSVYLYNSVVQQNAAVQGGGITNSLGRLVVRQSTISNNSAAESGIGIGEGGGIYSDGTLEIFSSFVQDNTAKRGGGISGTEFADLYISEATFSGNKATGEGGAIFNDKTVSLYDVTISDNEAARGAGLFSSGGGSLYRSTINNNRASQWGGGIFVSASNVNLENVTLSANQAASQGGAVYIDGNLFVRQATFADNSAPEGASFYLFESGNVNIGDSLFFGPQDNHCAGTTQQITSWGYNLENGDTCLFHVTGDQINIPNPGLLPLAQNLGKTKTHALQLGSPAIDRGNPTGIALTDQRHVIRPVDGNSDGVVMGDIGAFEFYDKGLLSFQPKAYVKDEPNGSPVQVKIEVARLSGTLFTEVSYASELSLDIIPVNGTLLFPPGDPFPKFFNVTVLDDPWLEPDQTILLRIFNPKYSVAILEGDNLATLTIPANDPLGQPEPPLFPHFMYLSILHH